MKKIIGVIVLITILTSCATSARFKKKPLKGSSVETKTNTVTIIRDTTIYITIPGDTVFHTMPLDDGEVSKLVTPLAFSYAWLNDGKVFHRLEQRDTVVPKNIKGALKTTIAESHKQEIKDHIEYINKLSTWQWLQVYFGRVFMGVLMIFIGSLIGRAVLRR